MLLRMEVANFWRQLISCVKTRLFLWSTKAKQFDLHYSTFNISSHSVSKSAIPDRRELKKSFNDADGVCAWDTIWINKFEESTNQGISFPHRFSTTSITCLKLIIMRRSIVWELRGLYSSQLPFGSYHAHQFKSHWHCKWSDRWVLRFYDESTKTVSKDIGKVSEKISGDS